MSSRKTISIRLADYEIKIIIFSNEVKSIVDVKKKRRLSKDQIIEIIEIYYEKDIETEDIIVDKYGFMTFTKYFKYLGYFSLNLERQLRYR